MRYAMIFLIGGIIGIATMNYSFKSVAIEMGFAEYNQTTGDWQWKDSLKCREE